MLIISYDISDDKKRTKFSKFLEKFGYRVQYSVFQVDNSERFLRVIQSEIEHKFSKTFDESDSVIIFRMTNSCETIRYGYARNDDNDVIIIK